MLYLFEISLVDPLILTIILFLFKFLYQYHISKLSSTSFPLLSISLFIVYTFNLLMVQPRSCWVIYYFDTPILRRRHQLFDRVIFSLGVSAKFRFIEGYIFCVCGKDLVFGFYFVLLFFLPLRLFFYGSSS
jgi:hypothetical protein